MLGVSLYRPGPMDQIPRYIRNKLDPTNSEYTHSSLEPILNVTYGCMVYQEQVMQIVRDLAGYSLGRADLVRRAMGKKKLDVMAKEREYFIHGEVDEKGNILIPGCVRNGIDEKSANKIFDEMAEFAKYAFNKSHAAAYAVISYQTAYLKTYYPEEFMAATLNSYLGNLDRIPIYIEECKRLGIHILKPDINKSYTKFTVDNGKIRFGLGSIKNVGVAAVDCIVKERKENGEFLSFTDFCERIQGESVNKKCIESLIKAGAFDEFEQTKATLMSSFESIIDTIQGSNKKSYEGQVTMFDLGSEDEKDDIEEFKYNFNIVEEYSQREILTMEKEMLGLYISGHPLDKMRESIARKTTINTFKMREINDALEEQSVEYKDGQIVKYAGVINSVKKKYTKNNKIMAFLSVEDLYGTAEIIVFENCYNNSSSILISDSIVLIEGRLSIREDDDVKIVANNITSFGNTKKVEMIFEITGLEEKTKAKLRGAIKYYSGESSNMPITVKEGEKTLPCGSIYSTPEIISEFEEILGQDRVKLIEVE